MKKSDMRLLSFFICGLFGLALQAENKNIQFITSAPTGAPDEPIYQLRSSPSVDWFSEAIGGDYYLGALAPTLGSVNKKTIALYKFIPGNPPSMGLLEFVASAPTEQCIFDQFSSEDVCDDLFNSPFSLSWFPRAIGNSYFFGVVGSSTAGKLGLPGGQTIRVYQFNPGGNEPIIFIDSAPLQVSENEPPFSVPRSVDWFLESINGLYYFSVVGELAGGPPIRVYSFDPAAPLGTNLSFVGETAATATGLSVDWLPELVGGNSYFAVGGSSDTDQIRVYQFCPDGCVGSASPENNVRLIATAPTTAVLDVSIQQANAVEWLVVNGKYYLAAAVSENQLSSLRKQRTVRIYEFIPGKNDPTQGTLRFVTSAPTSKECCASQIIDDNLRNPVSLDWLAQNGRHFLVVGSAVAPQRSPLSGRDIRVYEFDTTKEQLQFIAAEDLSPDAPLSVNWFPGLIEGNNYFAAGIDESSSSGTESKEVRIYKFRPPCNFTALSCRNQEGQE